MFCHTNPWVMIAETRVGDGDRAFDYYLRINPSAREEQSDVHRCEPYVYAQMIAGKDAPTHGEAKNSWLTGTAAWNFVALTQWILGIRPDHDGLRIDPCLPADWEGFTATRRFREATYRIRVGKRRGATGRVSSLVVDGRAPSTGTSSRRPPRARRSPWRPRSRVDRGGLSCSRTVCGAPDERRSAMPIIGAHALLYTPEAEAVRAILRDVLELDHVDAGDGWLIFELPPAEVGVHPTGMGQGDPAADRPHHELSFMCDDIAETVADLRSRGIEIRGEPTDQGYGIVVTMVLPGGLDVGLYEPRHPTAI